MIWGMTVPVPTLGTWAVTLLCGALLVFGWRSLSRDSRSRAVAISALLLALIFPITRVFAALPYTFTNGTIADATQVNANFASLDTRSFKHSGAVSSVTLASGVPISLTSVTFTAPMAGTVWAMGTGYCNTFGQEVVAWVSPISGGGAQDFSGGGGVGIWAGAGTGGLGQLSFAVQDTFAVSAGSNVIYLNLENPAGSSGSSCNGGLTIFFTPNTLP
jgi:hypothetical protein